MQKKYKSGWRRNGDSKGSRQTRIWRRELCYEAWQSFSQENRHDEWLEKTIAWFLQEHQDGGVNGQVVPWDAGTIREFFRGLKYSKSMINICTLV